MCQVTAATSNPSSKPLNKVDVYGRVYDAAGSAVTDVSENNLRLRDNIPAGTSKVSFVSTCRQRSSSSPLKWQGLKASGFAGKILPGQTGADGLLADSECDLAPDPAEVRRRGPPWRASIRKSYIPMKTTKKRTSKIVYGIRVSH